MSGLERFPARIARRPPPVATVVPASSPRRGVALVDMVISVGVMGILAAVAIPRFADASANLRAESTARRVAAELNFARRTAILTSRTTTITFVVTPASYTMTNVPDPYQRAANLATTLADVDANARFGTVQFDGGLTLSFNPYGRPLASNGALASSTIQVKVGGRQRNVTIDLALGEAVVQ